MALHVTPASCSYPLVSQVVVFMMKINYLVMNDWFIAANVIVMNSCANVTNSNAKLMNLTAKPTNSIANVMDSIANGTKLIVKVTDSNAKS